MPTVWVSLERSGMWTFRITVTQEETLRLEGIDGPSITFPNSDGGSRKFGWDPVRDALQQYGLDWTPAGEKVETLLVNRSSAMTTDVQCA